MWPVDSQETKKLLPLAVIFALVTFNYSVLRNLKDALVITADGAGAEVIPFIKLWGLLPAAILAAMLFSFMLNRFSRTTVFVSVVSFFILFFFVFGFFIYPHRQALHPHQFADFLESVLPQGCRGFIAMFRNWTLSCFYIVAELWGSVVLQVLAWGLANEVTKLSEAPRFYGIIAIAANLSAIVAGQFSVMISRLELNFAWGHDAWERSLAGLLVCVVLLGIGILITYRWVRVYLPSSAPISQKKAEKKLSFRESLSCIANSKYLMSIAILVMSYNLVINLVEVLWKDRLRVLYPMTRDYNVYINNLTSLMGVVSAAVSVVMVRVVHRVDWTKIALLTPVVIAVTSAAFFLCLFAGDSVAPFASVFLGVTPLSLAVFFGSFQNCFAKAAKYSVFDATKEMAYIPLSIEQKTKGKSAIDGIGSRMAKSGGAAIHQVLLLMCGTLPACSPYVAIIVALVVAAWIGTVSTLGKEFRRHQREDAVVVPEEVVAS
jgi:AAA family ATP:ADP antiporter